MNTVNTEAIEDNSNNLQKKFYELQSIYSNNRNNLNKRKELRENRLRQINQYRDEQVAALKH